MTEEETLQKAKEDEETCKDLIAMIKKEDNLDEVISLLKKIKKIVG